MIYLAVFINFFLFYFIIKMSYSPALSYMLDRLSGFSTNVFKLEPSLAEHLVPTHEATDTETGSRAALRASRQLPRGSHAPRHCKAQKAISGVVL